MAIEKLTEFAKDGQKNVDGLTETDGFPVLTKPARQWFNWLFNSITTKINEIIDQKIDFEDIIDNLTTNDATQPVSAKQAKVLQDNKLDKTSNAVSATKLATARTIGGVSFDGTANINLPGVNAAGNQNTTGNAATATTSAACSGNAATASALQTARTINGISFNGTANITVYDGTKLPLAGGTLTGDVSGTSLVMTGTIKSGTSLAATLVGLGLGTTTPFQSPSTNIGTSYGYVPILSGIVQTSSGYRQPYSYGAYRPSADWTNSGVYIAVAENDNNPTEAFLFQVGRRISNSAGAIALAGNADTATKLATARTIALTGASQGSATFDGSGNISISTTGLGVGQTWQDLTASRASNTTYTNSTGKPILLALSIFDSGAVSAVSLTVAGVGVVQLNDIDSHGHFISTIVPNGSTYNLNAGSNTITKWAELR